jgi:Mg-chelatase subunit ChlD
VVIAVGVAVTLNQPEWREIFKPETKPALVILADVSRSMQTRDMIDAANPLTEPKSRQELEQPLMDVAAWKEVAQRMDVVVEPFSSAEQPPEDGTDIAAALAQAVEKHPRLNAVVLLSDGDWNTGQPPAQAATLLRMRKIPVFAVPL